MCILQHVYLFRWQFLSTNDKITFHILTFIQKHSKLLYVTVMLYLFFAQMKSNKYTSEIVKSFSFIVTRVEAIVTFLLTYATK